MFSERWKTGIEIFGVTHIVTLCVLAAVLAAVILLRKQFAARPLLDKIFRYSLCAFAVAIELTYWGWTLFYIKDSVLEILPMELCAITLWLTVIGVVFKLEKLLKVTFFWSTTGVLLALIVVQGDYAPPHFRFFHYFLVHFSFLLLNCYMVATGKVRISFKDSLIAGVALVITAIPIFIVNKIAGTNYMYTNHLPSELAAVENAIGFWYLPLFVACIFAMFLLFYLINRLCFFVAAKIRKARETKKLKTAI